MSGLSLSLIQIVRRRVKEAALLPEVELQPQQKRVVEKLQKEPVEPAYPALRSGKTLSSLASGELIGGQKAAIVLAALRENYRRKISKFTDQPSDTHNHDIISYNKAMRKGLPESTLTIFDEAHPIGRARANISKLAEVTKSKVQWALSNSIRGSTQRLDLTEKAATADVYTANLSDTMQQPIAQFLDVLRKSGIEQSPRVSKAAHIVNVSDLRKAYFRSVFNRREKKADYAPGLPDPKRFGDVAKIPPGEVLKWVVQRHLAQRAGPHYDVRFGLEGNEPSLYSWATKKELPEPGGKIMLYQQPLHRGQYAEFEGEIEEGYGKGSVKKHDYGNVIVTKAEPDKIQFVVTHKRLPEFYTMVRMGGPPAKGSVRTKATQGGSWLMINTTPMSAIKMLGGKFEEVGMNKLKYGVVPADKVDKLFDPKYMIQEKVDGASALYHLMGDRIEALSYRVSKTGRPIAYTYKIFGPQGAKVSIPKELQGTIVRGEVYGEREGKAIPPQELGGLLNASISNSLQKQKEQNVSMRNMLFDVVRYGKEPVKPNTLTGEERMAKLQEIMKHLPESSFRLPETARTPEEQRKLYERITSGEHPSTYEGIVAWPARTSGRAIKVKPRPERDVWIQNIFPGEGKYKDSAGGFEYSLSPEGEIVGRVGTGFDDPTRKQMMEEAEDWKGRLARITASERFPSGAYRAPAFVALHHDYPLAKTGAMLIKAALGRNGTAVIRERNKHVTDSRQGFVVGDQSLPGITARRLRERCQRHV